MARPTADEARNTRQDILNASLDLFAERGVAGTSVRQIAQAVGVAESALYYHFSGGKDAILSGVMEETVAGRLEPFRHYDDKALADITDVGALLHALTDRLLESWSAPREHKLFQMFLREGFRIIGMGLKPDFFNDSARVTSHFFGELSRRGHLADLDPMLLGRQFLGPLFLLRVTCMMQGEIDVRTQRDAAHEHVSLFLKATRRADVPP